MVDQPYETVFPKLDGANEDKLISEGHLTRELWNQYKGKRC